jgi:hypothetical protein
MPHRKKQPTSSETFGATPPMDAPPPDTSNDFREILKSGYYLGLLDDYMETGEWDRERIARDALQNFFDSNNYTLDGIEVDITEGDVNTALIKGAASYPYTRLLHFGGGHKEDKRRASGGKHEGTRVMALHLLRDYGATEMAFGSEDWELKFYFAPPPKGSVEPAKEHLRGLHVRLSDTEQKKGNYLQIKTNDRAMVEEIIGASDLFFNSRNPDFQKAPTVETEAGGFIFLSPPDTTPSHTGQKTNGNFYLNGQRIHFKERGKWDTVNGFVFYSKQTPTYNGRELVVSRDRDLITYDEFESIYIPFLVGSMSRAQLEGIVKALEPLYVTGSTHPEGVRLLSSVVEKLAKQNYSGTFPDNHLALNSREDWIPSLLKDLGFTLCHGFLSKIGMQGSSDYYKELMSLKEVAPEAEHEERIDILKTAAQEFITFICQKGLETITTSLGAPNERGYYIGLYKLQTKDVHLFAGAHPALKGKYDEDFVWMKKAALEEQNIHRAFSVYIHELCHTFGDDDSSAFSYALTDVIAAYGNFLSAHPEFMSDLEKKWDAVTFRESLPSPEELREKMRQLIKFPTPESELARRHGAIDRASKTLIEIWLSQETGDLTIERLIAFYEEIEAMPVVQAINENRYPQQKLEKDEQDILDKWNGIETAIDRKKSTLKKLKEDILLNKNLHKRRDKREEAYRTAAKPHLVDLQQLEEESLRFKEEATDLGTDVNALQTQQSEAEKARNEFTRAFRNAIHSKFYGTSVDLYELHSRFPQIALEAIRQIHCMNEPPDPPALCEDMTTIYEWAHSRFIFSQLEQILIGEAQRACWMLNPHSTHIDLMYAKKILDFLSNSL